MIDHNLPQPLSIQGLLVRCLNSSQLVRIILESLIYVLRTPITSIWLAVLYENHTLNNILIVSYTLLFVNQITFITITLVIIF